MNVNLYPLVRGLASYVLPRSVFRRPGSGGTFSSKYCYSVWLRHVIQLLKNGLITDVRQLQNIAEIGPGDSLGIGLSALFTGASKYYCFDVIRHASVEANLTITKELEVLFIDQTPIPNGKGFDNVNPSVDDYNYPSFLKGLTSQYFTDRSTEIQCALGSRQSNGVMIDYVVPWTSRSDKDVKDLDLIFSQAVMEHVTDIEFAYREMHNWLKPGGIVSHQIDFRSHEMTKPWNGHWFISEGIWSILSHGRKYPMNRLPLSAHIQTLERIGFQVKSVLPVKRANSFNAKPKMILDFTEEDLTTSSALVQALKI